MDELNELLGALPGFDLLSPSMKLAALNGALIPDDLGVWPGQQGYTTTYDVYFAALTLLGFLRAQPFVRNANSEGTGVTVDAPDWAALTAYFRALSPIAAVTGSGALQRVAIPDGPYLRRVDMNRRDAYYGDVDTDLG